MVQKKIRAVKSIHAHTHTHVFNMKSYDADVATCPKQHSVTIKWHILYSTIYIYICICWTDEIILDSKWANATSNDRQMALEKDEHEYRHWAGSFRWLVYSIQFGTYWIFQSTKSNNGQANEACWDDKWVVGGRFDEASPSSSSPQPLSTHICIDRDALIVRQEVWCWKLMFTFGEEKKKSGHCSIQQKKCTAVNATFASQLGFIQKMKIKGTHMMHVNFC